MDRVSVHVGVRLITMVDPRRSNTIFDRIGALRRQFAQQMGLIIPLVRLRDDLPFGGDQHPGGDAVLVAEECLVPRRGVPIDVEFHRQRFQLRQATQVPASPGGPPARPMLKSLSAVDRALLRAAAVEVTRIERNLSVLATTASISPFIGLFGTVWGIMTSFQRIASVGSTNLGVVAPGIAEALIATAAGLFAAIPAVYFYNHFVADVKRLTSSMDDFSLEFLNIAERNFT